MKIIFSIHFLIILLLSPALYTGCILKDLQKVRVLLPGADYCGEIAGIVQYELKYYSAGKLVAVTGLEPGESADIEIEKETVPFAAYPYLKEEYKKRQIYFKPAGAVFPENYDSGEIELSFINGFAAEIILNLSEKGADFSSFNIARFEDVLEEKSGGNPWRVSDTVVLYALSAGIFNSNHVTLRQSFNIGLSDCFLEGCWLFADPLESKIINAPDGSIFLENIYTGNHILVSTDLYPVKTAELFIDNEDWTVFFSSGEGGLSGHF